MSFTSKTGLIASPIKPKLHSGGEATVHLCAIARKAPFGLKPFAALYNPYPYGCSLLCNHPTDTEARDLIRRVKNSWLVEGKNILLTEEIEAIRDNLQKLHGNRFKESLDGLDAADSVPEELFRR